MDKTIGIIGGGQLGKMLMEAGMKWNLTFNVLDQNNEEESICNGIIKKRIEGSLHDNQKIRELANISDVLTFEIEDIDVQTLFDLEKENVKIIPFPKVLKIIQDKGRQKDFFKENNVSTVDYVHYPEKLNKFKDDQLVVIKKCQGGYDGKGVQITNIKDFVFEKDNSYIVEKYISKAREFAVMVASDQNNNILHYLS